MSKIKILDEQLINKIAAGEVVERPSSVVKELIENSLDANATQITIEIEDSGKKLIRITDNGEGMSEVDCKNSLLRHATSKISHEDDLFAITTLGFRGEALASIAAVSQLSIITKQEGELEGFNLVVEGGSTISSGVVASEQGTTIEICNLFFNTPARKKFLKSDAVELRHIIDIVTYYSLINSQISFKLLHEKHELLHSPAIEEMRNNIASIYGISLAKELLEVNYENDLLKIRGFIGKPHQARNDKNQQVLFVNGRWIKNQNISKAVYDGFHSLLFVGKHPLFFLDIKLNPQKVDVNVHPQKSEIKIEQKKEVYNTILKVVKRTLQEHNLIPLIEADFEQQSTFAVPKKTATESSPKYTFEPSAQTILQVNEATEDFNIAEEYATPEEEVFVSEHDLKHKIPQTINLPPMKLLGQIHKTFFVAETVDGVLFIDQHVVQERVLYERFMEQFMNKQVATQVLLQGEMMEFSPAETVLVQAHQEELVKFGFTLEHFGENTFIVKTVPAIFGRIQPKEMISELLSQIGDHKNRLQEVQEEIITRMACRASVKAGDTMTIPALQRLLEELTKCKLPYTCPHGRAIFIKLSVDELEKKFKRK